MSTQDFGIMAMFTMAASILQALILFNANGAVVAMFYRLGLEESQRLSKAGFFLLSMFALATFACMIGAHILIPEFLMMSLPWTLACVTVAALNAAFNYATKIYQMQEKAAVFATWQISLAALSASLSVWLVVGEGLGWQGRAGGWLAGSAICVTILIRKMSAEGWIRLNYIPDRAALQPVLNYSIPLMPHTFATLISSMTDRMYIGFLSGPAALGIYSVGSQLAMAVTLAFGAFNLSFSPWLFRKLSSSNPKEIHNAQMATRLSCGALLVLALMLSLVMPPLLPFLTGEKFAAARHVLPMLFFAAALDGMAKVQQHYLAFSRQTGKISRITVAGFVVAVILMTIFVPLYGEQGAAGSLLASNLIVFGLSTYLSSRFFVEVRSVQR